jgi:hypothetical protein
LLSFPKNTDRKLQNIFKNYKLILKWLNWPRMKKKEEGIQAVLNLKIISRNEVWFKKERKNPAD